MIEDAVQSMRSAHPPLQRPALDAVLQALIDATQGNEAAWAFSVEAGAYEQVVRCMDAYSGDADLQGMCCAALSALGSTNVDGVPGHWASHAEAAVRAGAVRAAVSALLADDVRNELVGPASMLASVAWSGGTALEIVRAGRAAERLARSLPLALRAAASTGDTFVLDTIMDALAALVHSDDVCAQQAACPGTLAALAQALQLHGAGSYRLACAACTVMHRITAHASADECAAAADDCVNALRAALVSHDRASLQDAAWDAMFVLLTRDARAMERACAAGVAADAVRSLRSLAAKRADAGDAAENLARAIEHACDALALLTGDHARSRRTAHAKGAVLVLGAALRAHGDAHPGVVERACYAMTNLLQTRPENILPDVILRIVADVAAAMRRHAGDEYVQCGAASALHGLVAVVLLSPAPPAGGAAGAPPPDASDQARRLAETVVLEAAAGALRAHSASGPGRLRNDALAVLVLACSGEAFGENGGPPLQPSVAARAQRAGIGALLAEALPTTNTDLRARADTLAAALARLPPPPACAGCGTTDALKLLRCSRCRTARFCGVECQHASWAVHKTVCVPPAATTPADEDNRE